MMRYGVVGVGYFGADLARFMNEFDDAQINHGNTTLKMVKPLLKNYNV